MNKAVFFDRDGVMTKNVNGEAPTRIADLELIPEIIPIVSRLGKIGYKVFVLSNQPDAALGIINEETKIGLVKKFKKLLKKNHISVDQIYYCFHASSEGCSCHKPKPGMILKALHDYNISPTTSFIIGDRASDIKAGDLAGVQTILLDPKNSEEFFLELYNVKPDYIIKELSEALKVIKSS